MKHGPIVMDRKDFMAEHARLAKVLKGAKTAAASKELARQMAEVKRAKGRPMQAKPSAIVKGRALEY